MMKILVIAFLYIFTLIFPAVAQQLPSQVAIQMDTVINQWAQTIEIQQKQIEDLKKENAELKSQCEAKK